MNLSRVLQPYVCCLGNPVAGNPTQFVMYRAARACGVDWRFFTSQVEVDQFEIAFRGVQALGLSGVALFDPFQSEAMPLLDSVTESAMCLGRVNVARLDGNSWLGDNTLGTGIINCIEPLLEASRTSISSERTDQEGDRQSTILVVGDTKIADAMRLANPRLAKRIVVVHEGIGDQPKQFEREGRNPNEAKDLLELASLEEFSQSGSTVNCLVLASVPNAAISRQIAGLSWTKSANCLVLASASEKQLRLWRDSMKVHNVNHVDPVELMAHQAAADFNFWTGVNPAIDLIRDSLEEYMQW